MLKLALVIISLLHTTTFADDHESVVKSTWRRFLGSIGHAISCAFKSCHHTVVVHHNPPSIHCAGNPSVIAPVKSITARVTWAEPKGATRHGPAPGSYFHEGGTTVSYTIKDGSTGLSNSCTMKITVRVVRCPSPSPPLHGTRHCSTTGGRMVYGDTCTFSCGSGYFMTGAGTTTCASSGRMTSAVPACKPVPCGNPRSIANGHFACNGIVFGNVCHVTCANGYTVDKMAKSITCRADRSWSHTRGCLDLKPPLFHHCPSSKLYFADRGTPTTRVKWEMVTAHDPPTHLRPLVKQTHGPRPGSVVLTGQYVIQYTATDAAGNVAVKPCSFNVTVHAIHCGPPHIDVHRLLQYDCPSGHAHGNTCNLRCIHGNLAGPDKIVCERDNSFPPTARWQWDRSSGIKPYCKIRSCPPLRAPRGGALSCDRWQHGGTCQMQCQRGYTFPASAHSGIYKCAQTLKKWFPTSSVPDCLATATFYSMVMPARFFYRGQCSQRSLSDVRHNFLRALRASLFGVEMCRKVRACQANNVKVSCGTRFKRDENNDGVTITVAFSFPYDRVWNSRRIKQAKDKFLNEVHVAGVFGLLDLQGHNLSLQMQHTVFGEMTPVCRDGEKAVNNTCSGCGPGYVMNSISGSCVACPIGHYQEQPSAVLCQPCPLGYTTAEAGSSSFEDCRVECAPGQYSASGLSPCLPCQSGNFQPLSRSTECRACPRGTLTQYEGAKSVEECQAYDVKISAFGDVTFKPLSRDLSTWSYCLWVKFVGSSSGDVLLGLWMSESNEKMVSLSLTNLTVNAFFYKIANSSTPVVLQPTWNQITWVSSRNEVKLYVNHRIVIQTTQSVTIPRHSRLHVVADATDVIVSRVVLHNYALSDSRIEDFALSCTNDETPRDLDLDSIDYDQSKEADVIFPSVCTVGKKRQ